MKFTHAVAFCLLCLEPLSCSDQGCPDKHVRIDGSCVLYVANVVTSSGGAAGAGQTSGGNANDGGTLGSAAQGGKQGGGAPATAQGGDVQTSGRGGGAPESGEGGTASGGAPMEEVAFGATCAAHADCGGDTNYCAMPPTEPPYCTASGCDQDASLCPTGYECLDLGLFVPGEPFVCVKSPEVGSGAFGDVCETSEDCSGDTNYCAFSPTEPPYCSVSGCDSSPALCPTDWTCLDVGQFVPGEPFVCVKPAP